MGRIRTQRASGCWIELFDAPQFHGNRCRLHGPAAFLGLRVRERHWGEQVQSLAVGPTAYVQCFRAADFDDTVIWLLPSQRVDDVAELECDDIDSIRLFDRPPFASEPGYAAYMLWAASHLTRLSD